MCTGCLHDAVCHDGESCDCGKMTLAEFYATLPEAEPATLAVVPLIRQWFRLPNFTTGGPLHVQLDDYNLEDEHLTGESLDSGWDFYPGTRTPETDSLGSEIVRLLASLGEDSGQREMAVEAAHMNSLAVRLGVVTDWETPYRWGMKA